MEGGSPDSVHGEQRPEPDDLPERTPFPKVQRVQSEPQTLSRDCTGLNLLCLPAQILPPRGKRVLTENTGEYRKWYLSIHGQLCHFTDVKLDQGNA